MLIKNKGLKTDTFYLPPFELNVGEIVVLSLSNGHHSYEAATYLKDIFTGKTKDNHVLVNQKLTYVEHFIEPKFRRLIYPVTVGEYLKRNANSDSPYATKIYEDEWINKRTKVKTLAGNPRGLLRLYVALSKTNNIIFDLVGQDPNGVEQTYNTVKKEASRGGAAILLDYLDGMKSDCTQYVEVEWEKAIRKDTIGIKGWKSTSR